MRRKSRYDRENAGEKVGPVIELKNEADSLVYSTEKSLTEYGDKLEAEEKSEVEAQIAAVKELSAKRMTARF